jgi:vacuolar-type H+-ATPase subunit C/Vma6
MIRAGERAYVYAKACGIIGKSFVGRRIAALHPVTRLSEFDRLVFGVNSRELPERELLPDIERRILRRSVHSVVSIVNCFKDPPRFLSQLIRVYEYADLKTVLASIVSGTDSEPPSVTPLGRYNTVHFAAWPDAGKMLEGTEFAFLLEQGRLKRELGGISLETTLDGYYYRRLWEYLMELSRDDRMAAEKIIREEISLRNCAWALRLRTYYGMNADQVKLHLIRIEGMEELSADAEKALDFPLDSRGEWEKWKGVQFLNPGGAGIWQADPRYFQNAASEYLYKLVLRHFRLHPFSIDTCFCFIKLKQFEEDLLTSDAEGLGMGMSSKDVFGILEANL